MTNIDKFKDVLSGIANNIRAARGTTEKIPFADLVELSEGLEAPTQTYILVDAEGNEIPAVLVDEPVTLTATANDIRKGLVAVTSDGVVTGLKTIPPHYTTEGYKIIPSGSEIAITDLDTFEYTKLIAIVCGWNTTLNNSVSAEKVSINDNVYSVGSTESLSNVTIDSNTKSIKLGITNDKNSFVVLRYMTYKEEL